MSTPDLPPAPPSIPPVPAHNIFRGPNGIRAGWRALIFVAIFVALVVVLSTGIFLFTHGHAAFNVSLITPSGIGFGEGSFFVLAVIAALIMSRIEKRSWGKYGLPTCFAFGKDFWIGLLVGFSSISACLLAIFFLHGFNLTGLAIHGRLIATATLAWGVAFLVVGLTEEFVFRGYLQYTLTTGMGYWPAAILLSLLFGLAHKGNPGESIFGLLSVVVFGLLFCLILRRTGNLWWPVGFHAGWDWGQTFFYGVPDSGIAPYHNLMGSSFHGPAWLTGGTVGPEASVFTPIVLATVALLVAKFYRENKYQV